MKQLIQSARSGKLAVKDVPAPRAAKGELLVQTRASLISAGTERMVVDFAKKSLAAKAKARPDLVKKVLAKAKTDGIAATIKAVINRLDEPLPLGYSAAGVVIALGEGLEGKFRVGQRVAVAGAGLANHAEINAVPEHLAAPIPDGVADEHAAYGTLGAIALHAVRNLDAKLGETVAILGLGLVGQMAAQFLTLSGVRVIGLDYNATRLDLARRLGAEAVFDLAGDGVVQSVLAATQGRGCDGILIAAATETSEPFETAAEISRDRARVCLVGLSGTEFPYAGFMKKELSIIVSRSYGPGRYDEDYESRGVKYPEGFVRWTETENLAESVRLMDPSLRARLDVAALTTHRFAIEDAEQAYSLVMEQTEPHLGVLLSYPEATASPAKPAFDAPKAQAGDCNIGLIGAGNFARLVLLPELKKLSVVSLARLATKRGASAEHSEERFGFAAAGTDADDVINDPAVNAVIIANRHDAHAHLTAQALLAGKSVLVEKPLGLSEEEIDAVRRARETANGFFQVDFNRRFAPLAIEAKATLDKISGPKFMLFRINSGTIDADSWIQNRDEGGGRIIGELCHFVDLARFFTGAAITGVSADSPAKADSAGDDVTATIRFADGSLATIAYTAMGDPSVPKELYEIYAGGQVLRLDNFRSLAVSAGGKTTTSTAGSQDKGFAGALKAFVLAVTNGTPPAVDEGELIETSLATLAVLESLRTGERVGLG
ncbi:MAG: bi-domain-containing oxidoreductase [Rhodospirillaceae bacterium]